MNDFYLKAADEAELMAALEDAGLYEGGEPSIASPSVAVDIIGTISVPTGNVTTDAEGYEVPEYETLPGYHANLRGKTLPSELQSLEIPAPATPHRVWA